jgi:hypothetical protein
MRDGANLWNYFGGKDRNPHKGGVFFILNHLYLPMQVRVRDCWRILNKLAAAEIS